MSNSPEYDRLMDFLRPFSQGPKGFIGISIVDRDQDPEANKKWGSFRNIYVECEDGEVNLPEEALSEDPDLEYYFTPAILSEASRLQKNFHHSASGWIDFDIAVEWQTFDPPPSIVVQTSETKHHCYWLMADGITDVNDQRYFNAKLLKNFDGGDLSGFDATQLLKLPWGRNLKLGSMVDGDHFAPRIVKFDPNLRYPESAFSDLKEPTVTLPDAVDLSDMPDLPDIDLKKKWDRYAADYDVHNDIMLKLYSQQDGGEEKRSGALYSLQCTLLDQFDNHADMVFQVLYRSPNDKFTADHGEGRGAALLWKDINRVMAKQESKKANAGPIEAIKNILKSKVDFSEKGNQINDIVFDKLDSLGGFIQNDFAYYYVSTKTNFAKLASVTTKSDAPFAGKIRNEFGLNAGTDKSIISGILHHAVSRCQDATKIKFYHFSYYNTYKNVAYVDRYDGSMYVLDGKSIAHKPYGYDGVYFYPTESEFPKAFEYTPKYTPGAFESLILDGPNYTTDGRGTSRKEMRHLLKTWVASYFFPEVMDTKPIICIYGAADSGKTSLFQNLSILFTGDSTYSVAEMPKDSKQFNNDVTNNAYLFYDNVEVNKRELQEKLAQVATGYTLKQRKLYSTNESVSYKARCFVGITTRTLDKIQEDVAQRYIMIPVQPFVMGEGKERQSMSTILREVSDLRDELWSELLDYVNKMITTIIKLDGLDTTGVEIRMADYGALLNITCMLDGMSFPNMQNYIRQMQTAIMQQNDPLFSVLMSLLSMSEDKTVGPVSSMELLALASAVDRKMRSTYGSSVKLSKTMTVYINDGTFSRAGLDVEKHTSGKQIQFTIRELDSE